MAYDFVGKKIATSMNGAKNSRIYTQTLLGQTIDENPVPEWTADPDNYPFVTFQNPRNGKVWGFSKRQLAYGLLVVGAPGSGKTTCFNGLVKPILKTLKAGEVMVIFDPKGDYLREFASYVPVNERIVIGVGASYKNITSYHNLFAEVMPRAINGRLVYTPESDDEAFELAIQLSKTMDSQIQPVFPAMSAQLLAAGMIYLMRTYWQSDPSKLNNRGLVDFFQQKTVDELRKIFEEENMWDLRSCLDYIGNKGNQTQGVMSYLGAMIRKLFIGPFAQADPVREFSMRDIMNSGKRKVIFTAARDVPPGIELGGPDVQQYRAGGVLKVPDAPVDIHTEEMVEDSHSNSFPVGAWPRNGALSLSLCYPISRGKTVTQSHCAGLTNALGWDTINSPPQAPVAQVDRAAAS